MAEEGVGHCFYFRASQRHKHDHLTKTVHDRHDGVVAAVFRQVRDEVDVDLLPRGLRDWQWLVQPSQLTCVGLVALTNIATLTVPTYGIPHTWPVVPLSNHCVSAVHSKMAMRSWNLCSTIGTKVVGMNKRPLWAKNCPKLFSNTEKSARWLRAKRQYLPNIGSLA